MNVSKFLNISSATVTIFLLLIIFLYHRGTAEFLSRTHHIDFSSEKSIDFFSLKNLPDSESYIVGFLSEKEICPIKNLTLGETHKNWIISKAYPMYFFPPELIFYFIEYKMEILIPRQCWKNCKTKESFLISIYKTNSSDTFFYLIEK